MMIGLMKQYERREQKREEKISRMEFLRRAGMLAAVSIAGMSLTGCSSVRMILKSYPGRYDAETDLQNALLRIFVVTVIPGAPYDAPHATTIFLDPFYPFKKWCGFFISDLCDRSFDLYGVDRFDRLPADRRTAVIQSGLDAAGPVSRLYSAAILMAQASYYAGIYDSAQGCDLIDFPGANPGFSREEMCYTHNELFIPDGVTLNGNYA